MHSKQTIEKTPYGVQDKDADNDKENEEDRSTPTHSLKSPPLGGVAEQSDGAESSKGNGCTNIQFANVSSPGRCRRTER